MTIGLRSTLTCLALFLAMSGGIAADEVEELFSGPQVGEALTHFETQAAFGEAEKVAVLEGTMDGPVLLVFVHQVTRPSIGLTRLLMDYAAQKQGSGLESRLVFLTEDPTDAKAFLQRARHALPRGVQPSISGEGVEGPGAYGLNRKMTLTVLVASQGIVTANFPLVQPSIQADAPKIGHEIVKAMGGTEAPTLKEMGFDDQRMRRGRSNVARSNMARSGMARGQQTPERDAMYRRYMTPLIQKTASTDEVEAAAKSIEDFAAVTPWFKQRVYDASKLISSSPRLTEYGTAKAQEYIVKWADAYAPSNQPRLTNQSEEEQSDEEQSDEEQSDEDFVDSAEKSADSSTEEFTGDNG